MKGNTSLQMKFIDINLVDPIVPQRGLGIAESQSGFYRVGRAVQFLKVFSGR